MFNEMLKKILDITFCHVQVLVKELQAEEASWTNYDEDEAAVKTKVASEILDTLLLETVTLMSSILIRKLGYIAH